MRPPVSSAPPHSSHRTPSSVTVGCPPPAAETSCYHAVTPCSESYSLRGSPVHPLQCKYRHAARLGYLLNEDGLAEAFSSVVQLWLTSSRSASAMSTPGCPPGGIQGLPTTNPSIAPIPLYLSSTTTARASGPSLQFVGTPLLVVAAHVEDRLCVRADSTHS